MSRAPTRSISRTRRDQVRPRLLLPPGGRRVAQYRRWPSGPAPAVSPRRHREIVLPEAGALRRPVVAGDDHRYHSERNDLQRARGGRYRACGLGREPGLPRSASVAVSRRQSRRSPTSCGSTSIPNRASGSTRYEPRRSTAAIFSTELGLVGYPKTTGNRGLHIYLRLEARWDATGGAGRARWRWPESWNGGIPTLITANWWKEERGSGSLSTSIRTPRTRPSSGRGSPDPEPAGQVSTPLSWDEVADVVPDDLTIRTVPDLLQRRGDPWSEIGRVPQTAPTVARSGRAGQGRRAPRRALAARVPQGRRRADPGGTQPSEEVVARWIRSQPSDGSRISWSETVPTPTRSAPFATPPPRWNRYRSRT